jgi:hypothetical protein
MFLQKQISALFIVWGSFNLIVRNVKSEEANKSPYKQVLLAGQPEKSLYRRKGMVPHVQVSTNCVVVSERRKNLFFFKLTANFW